MQRLCIKTACLLLLAMLAADAASAQTDYPNNPVRLISDSGSGSAIDTGLRIIADGMSRYWNQQVVIVNQPGAAGYISATVASQAAPDGYTLYAPALSLFRAVPGKAPNLPLMVPRDFAAVGYAFGQLLVVAVSAETRNHDPAGVDRSGKKKARRALLCRNRRRPPHAFDRRAIATAHRHQTADGPV